MKVRIDSEACASASLCVTICPDVFELDDESLARVREEIVPANLEGAVMDAAETCPTEAIQIGS